MKLEEQFFHFFFYPFLVGVTLSSIIIITCSVYFTNDFIDKKTNDNLVELVKDYSKINIKSINVLISSLLLKVQIGFNELILYYQNVANKVKSNNTNINRYIDDNFLKCVLDLDETINENNENTSFMGVWLLSLETNLSKLKPNSTEKNQLITYSNMMRNIYSIFYSSNSTLKNIYFYFESTELFIEFPLIYEINNGFIYEIVNFTTNPVWCTDKNGEIYKIYKTKCRGFYNKIKKAKSDVFDINYKDNENRTIFVSDFYIQTGIKFDIVFSICIEFVDPISEKLAYICSDISSNELNYNMNNINSKINGFFFVNSVGFAHSFYYPQNLDEGLTTSENVFKWEKNFFLEEKMRFSKDVHLLMTSNYLKYIYDNPLYEEVFINGENANEQIFYLNGEKFQFSIYPVILENYNGNIEHVLNIIYAYNEKKIYDEMKIRNKIFQKIVIELIIIVIFGSGLLYLIVLSFNYLAKYIVIPIKNVNYMLKGINIGGKNRLEYLNFLKKRQDDNAERLEKVIII